MWPVRIQILPTVYIRSTTIDSSYYCIQVYNADFRLNFVKSLNYLRPCNTYFSCIYNKNCLIGMPDAEVKWSVSSISFPFSSYRIKFSKLVKGFCLNSFKKKSSYICTLNLRCLLPSKAGSISIRQVTMKLILAQLYLFFST